MRSSHVAMAIVAFAGAPFSVRAQSYDPWSCSGYGGVVFDETEQSAFCKGYNGGSCTGEYMAACQEGVRARSSGNAAGVMQQNQAQLDELERNRREVERLPALAPKGNPLLGRWQRVATNAPPPRNVYESLMAMGNEVACRFISGDGPDFEFRADALVHGTQTMDAMRYYRGQNGVVFALGERYRPPLAFEFDGPNRTIVGSCDFERVGAIAGTAQSSAAPPAQSSDLPPREVCTRMLIQEIGVIGADAARAAIQARYKEVNTGRVPNTPNLRLEASSSACDDQRVKAVLYDFDAGGMLRAITIAWSRPPGPAPAPIFSERAQMLAAWYPQGLTQSQDRLETKSGELRVFLQDMPEQGVLLEAYAK